MFKYFSLKYSLSLIIWSNLDHSPFYLYLNLINKALANQVWHNLSFLKTIQFIIIKMSDSMPILIFDQLRFQEIIYFFYHLLLNLSSIKYFLLLLSKSHHHLNRLSYYPFFKAVKFLLLIIFFNRWKALIMYLIFYYYYFFNLQTYHLTGLIHWLSPQIITYFIDLLAYFILRLLYLEVHLIGHYFLCVKPFLIIIEN